MINRCRFRAHSKGFFQQADWQRAKRKRNIVFLLFLLLSTTWELFGPNPASSIDGPYFYLEVNAGVLFKIPNPGSEFQLVDKWWENEHFSDRKDIYPKKLHFFTDAELFEKCIKGQEHCPNLINRSHLYISSGLPFPYDNEVISPDNKIEDVIKRFFILAPDRERIFFGDIEDTWMACDGLYIGETERTIGIIAVTKYKDYYFNVVFMGVSNNFQEEDVQKYKELIIDWVFAFRKINR